MQKYDAKLKLKTEAITVHFYFIKYDIKKEEMSILHFFFFSYNEKNGYINVYEISRFRNEQNGRGKGGKDVYMLTWKIMDASGKTKFVAHGEKEVGLVCTMEYREGDFIILEHSEESAYLWVQVDECLGSSLVYLTGYLVYNIPFGEGHISYPPNAFAGDRHYLFGRYARAEEIAQYRNLAVNVNDQHGDTGCYPHATANVETRGEAVFAARNAIDGIVENHSHGEWPYASWGINRREDACFTLEFGREVEADKIVIYERADFPHDNWWKEITVQFSDETSMVCRLKKTDAGQEITFPKKRLTWLRLEQLIKSDEPSPFPALTQIQVFGRDVPAEKREAE